MSPSQAVKLEISESAARRPEEPEVCLRLMSYKQEARQCACKQEMGHIS